MMSESGPEEPIVRKVQLTGGSTYTVSIPKEWATEQNIEPGSSIDIYARPDRLVLARGTEELDEDRWIAEIDAGSRDPDDLARYVTAAYVSGCDELRVAGPLDADRRRAVLDAASGLIGFETTIADDSGLVVRSMLDSSQLSLEQTLAQIELIALSMHEDAIEAVLSGADAAEQIADRDDAVDRLFALVCRQFHRSLVDPGTSMGTDRLTTFEYYTAARQLERIADHAEKTATMVERLEGKPPEDIATELAELTEEARSLVGRALAGLLEADDPARLSAVVADARHLSERIDELDQGLYERGFADGYALGTVLDSTSRTVDYGVNVAEAGLQASMRCGASRTSETTYESEYND